MREPLQELLATATKMMETVTEVLKQEQKAEPVSSIPQDMLSGKLTVTPKELGEALGVGNSTVYNLIHIEGFPSIQVGTRYVIPVQEFRQWMQDNAGKKLLQ